MEIKKKNLDNGYVRLVVNVSVNEVSKAFNEGLDLFVKQAGIYSAEGNTSEEKIKNVFYDNYGEIATRAVMNHLIPYALAEAGYIPVVAPIPASQCFIEKGKPFTMTIDVYPKPVFELSSYDPVKLLLENCVITDEEIEAQVQTIFKNYSSADSDAVEEYIDEVNDKWVSLHFPDNDVNTVDELREQLRTTGTKRSEETFDSMRLEQVLAEITSRLVGEIPSKILDITVEGMMENLKIQLAFQDRSFESYLEQAMISEKDLYEELRKQAYDTLARGFALDAIFRQAGLEVDESDINTAIFSMSHNNNEGSIEYFRRTGKMFLLEESAARLKAGRWAYENAIFVSA